MQRIREVTKKLLKAGIKPRGTPPYILHPIYSQKAYEIGGKTLYLPEDLKRIENYFIKEIEKADSTESLMAMVNKGKLQWLSQIREFVSNQEFSKLLGIAWTKSSIPNVEVPPDISKEWFENANKRALMNSREYAKWKNIPSRKKLYRGGKSNGLSWTDDVEVAKARGEVYVAYVPREDILAVFDRTFTGTEYICQPKKLTRLNSKE